MVGGVKRGGGGGWRAAEEASDWMCDECMAVEAFYSPAEAKVVIEDYRRYYRDQRPHSSLGYRTPNAFIAALAAATGVTSGGQDSPISK